MRTDKPLVSILLAAYKPNEKWFNEQLVSINQQNYHNLELIIWDDCPEHPFDKGLVESSITNIPYTIYKGETNRGSNFAFEELTKKANGKYIAYCDHDDIWYENKISVLVDKLEETGSPLACCDVRIIDADGNITGNSIKDAHKRHEFREGDNLAIGIISRNFVMGCASLVRTDIAKKALPLPQEFIHDHWIAIVAALTGRIEVIREPLISHRKHGGNQTGVLAGITDKESYYNSRILTAKQGSDAIEHKLKTLSISNKDFIKYKAWSNSRVNYYLKPNIKDFSIMNKYRFFNAYYTKFEQCLPFIPNFIVKILFKKLQRGTI